MTIPDEASQVFIQLKKQYFANVKVLMRVASYDFDVTVAVDSPLWSVIKLKAHRKLNIF